MNAFQTFLSSTAGIISSTLVIFGAIATALRWAFQVYRKFNDRRDQTEKRIEHIYNELSTNGGGSLKDAINRIEAFQIAGFNVGDKACWLSSPSGNCTFASTKLASYMGILPSQALGWGWVSAVAPEDRERCREEWESAVRDQREFRMKYAYVHGDGVRVNVIGHAIPVVHAQTGVVVGMIGWVELAPAN